VAGAALAGAFVPGAAARGLVAGPTPRAPSGPGPYLSRPDLEPPTVSVATAATDSSPGLIFIAPFDITDTAPSPRYGPLIVDDTGTPVWFKPIAKQTAMDFRAQRYKRQPVLTWYEGNALVGYGGDFVIADASYREIARVHATDKLKGDLHEFVITSRDTALVSIYSDVSTDLTPVGGPASGGQAVEGVVQEIEIATGKLLFEWHSLAHVPLTESIYPMKTQAGTIDYFHLNSIGVDLDGNLLVSSRHTSTVYKVDRKSGRVIWRLGGLRSDFAFAPEAQFSYQHDVRRHADGTLTIFDNHASDQASPPLARAIRLAVDQSSMTATLLQSYAMPQPRQAWAMGNAQQLPDDGIFVCWGTAGSFSEFASDGTVLFDAALDGVVTYRAFRLPWVGQPATRPAIGVVRDSTTLLVYASWNGATEVMRWQVRAGARPSLLSPVQTVARTGFETEIVVPAQDDFVAVAALDAKGHVLGTSAAVPV